MYRLAQQVLHHYPFYILLLLRQAMVLMNLLQVLAADVKCTKMADENCTLLDP